jgi:thermostable 8-oxoguanine DNA glycosylase
MSQTLHYWVGDTEIRREMPGPDDTIIPGVRWGDHWALFTPAYWLSQLWMSGLDQNSSSYYRAKGSLCDEIAFCMLGGYGIAAELATAAFENCQKAGLIERLETSAARWTAVLQQPIEVNGSSRRYRYPLQKARFLAGAMVYIQEHPISTSCGKELRDELLHIDGVGPKTAGWIARNYLDTDDVAILDIHIVRAGLLCDLFSPTQRVERNYFAMESRFIDFCRALEARPAVLDCLIWDQMRSIGRLALDALNAKFGERQVATYTSQAAPGRTTMQLARSTLQLQAQRDFNF